MAVAEKPRRLNSWPDFDLLGSDEKGNHLLHVERVTRLWRNPAIIPRSISGQDAAVLWWIKCSFTGGFARLGFKRSLSLHHMGSPNSPVESGLCHCHVILAWHASRPFNHVPAEEFSAEDTL